jgi:hypothetical protein
VSDSKFILFINEIVVKLVVNHDNQMKKAKIIFFLKKNRKYLADIEILMNFFINEINIKNKINGDKIF